MTIGCNSDKIPQTQAHTTKQETKTQTGNSQSQMAEKMVSPTIIEQKALHKEQEAIDEIKAIKKATAENQTNQKKKPEKLAKQRVKKTKKSPSKTFVSKKTKALPKIKFEKIRHDFGTITQGDTVDYKFKFINEGKAPLVIKRVQATCGCTQPSYPFMPIEAGEEGFIGVRYVSVGKEGSQKPLISVFSNSSEEPQALMLAGVVEVLTKEKDKLRNLK